MQTLLSKNFVVLMLSFSVLILKLHIMISISEPINLIHYNGLYVIVT